MATINEAVPSNTEQPDSAAETKTPEQLAKYWDEQLDLSHKDHKDFLENGKRVLRRYKTEKSDDTRSGGRHAKRFNVLYSNTELLLAALYGKMATPDVRRRYTQSDPTSEEVAEIIESALVYCNETYGDKPIEDALKDYLLPGRGTVRIDYEPVLRQDPDTKQTFITDQILRESYIYWKDFRCMPARTWADIEKNGWIAFRHRMNRDELLANFGPDAKDVPLNWAPEIDDRKNTPDSTKKAEVWEIWDIVTRKRYWIVEAYKRCLRSDDDPYGLEGFFPCPEPISYYSTTDTVVPEPEFFVYKDQADDLDEIIQRISRLTKALKRRGVYDQSIKELSRLASATDNQFLPVENYGSLMQKGGLQAAFQAEDISITAGVLVQLYQQRDALLQSIWEIVGIADIMRGASDSQETLGAQKLKSQYGSQRMMRRQRSIQRWIRDLHRIKAEIIAEHFQPDILQQITGKTVTPEIVQVLRTDKLRSYRIDIETDSTVFEDQQLEQQSRGQMVQALTAFIEGWGPITAQEPVMMPLAFELLKFGLGGFKSTRPIEDAIDQAAQVMEQRAAQNQYQPSPSPEQIRSQTELQARQMEMQIEQGKAQNQAALAEQELHHKSALAELDRNHKAALANQEMQLEREKHAQQMEFEREKHGRAIELEHVKLGQQREMHGQKLVQDRELEEQKLAQQGDIANRQIEASKKPTVAIDGSGVKDAVGPAIEQAIAPAMAQLAQVFAEAMKQLTESLAQSQQQSAAQLAALLGQSHKQLGAVLSAPRRRIPVRDENGRITEAHDMPLTVQ